MSRGKQATQRVKKTEQWKKHQGEVSREEGLAFGNGFNAGWKAHMKTTSKFYYVEISEILNNLEEDLKIDSTGESGYKNEKESIEAIKKYTLKLLIKKFKMAKHNIEVSKRSKK